MDAAHFVRVVWPYLVVGAPGIWAAIKTWSVNAEASAEAKRRDKNDLIQIAQDAAGAVIAELRAEIDRLRGELDQLRREHSEMMAAKDARIAVLEGDLRNKEAEIRALERELERHGLTVPTRTSPFFEVKGGRLEPQPTGGPPP